MKLNISYRMKVRLRGGNCEAEYFLQNESQAERREL